MEKITIIILSLFFNFPLFAETIILKSGKIVTGKILDKTDKNLTVDEDGIPGNSCRVKFSLDEIEHIHENAVDYYGVMKKESTATKWVKWYQNVRGYIDQLSIIHKKMDQIANELNQQGELAVQQNNELLKERAFTDAISKISLLIKDLEKIIPPEEVKEYHRKTLILFEDKKRLYEVLLDLERDKSLTKEMLEKDPNSIIVMHVSNAIKDEAECWKELKRVYIQHDAPQELILKLDLLVTRYN